MVTFFTSAFESQSIGLGSAVLLLTTGLVLMYWVREERADIPIVHEPLAEEATKQTRSDSI
jgi:MFS-type transporter involved in bile tolerance (Atg22 family)